MIKDMDLLDKANSKIQTNAIAKANECAIMWLNTENESLEKKNMMTSRVMLKICIKV